MLLLANAGGNVSSVDRLLAELLDSLFAEKNGITVYSAGGYYFISFESGGVLHPISCISKDEPLKSFFNSHHCWGKFLQLLGDRICSANELVGLDSHRVVDDAHYDSESGSWFNELDTLICAGGEAATAPLVKKCAWGRRYNVVGAPRPLAIKSMPREDWGASIICVDDTAIRANFYLVREGPNLRLLIVPWVGCQHEFDVYVEVRTKVNSLDVLSFRLRWDESRWTLVKYSDNDNPRTIFTYDRIATTIRGQYRVPRS